MADLASLTEDVQEMLYGTAKVERPKEDTLAASVASAGTAAFEFTTDTMWKRDDYAEDQAAGEIVILAEDHPTSGTAVVRRGQRGTTAAASYASGDVFLRNPMFPRRAIERMIEEVIESELDPHVWTWGKTSFTFVPGTTYYEMPADAKDAVQVYQVDIDGQTKFYPIGNEMYEFLPVVDTAVSSTGVALRLFGQVNEDFPVYVTYKQEPTFAAIDEISDEIAGCIPWRVTGKLLSGTRVGPARVAPGRAQPIAESGNAVKQDAQYFDVEFRRKRKDVRLKLKMEQRNMQRKKRRRQRDRRG